MVAKFDRDQLLAALDEVGHAAIDAKTRLDIADYGGAALMLASSFRFSTEDVDLAELHEPWPDWLSAAVDRIAERNRWSKHWLNDGVTFHLSSLAEPKRDLLQFGTFPRGAASTGLTVFLPSARYMLALKLKALRISDSAKGESDMADVANLLRVLDITEVEPAVSILSEYFPKSGADADKQRFVLSASYRWKVRAMRPATLAEAIDRIISGAPQNKTLPEFLDSFYLAPTPKARLATLKDEPEPSGDRQLDAYAAAMAEYLARQYSLPELPKWVFGRDRFLEHAWHVSPFDDPAMREYLTWASPAEFRSRNIFTEERPLRRARTPIASRTPVS